MDAADKSEIDAFREEHPEIQMLELMMPDINGILRGKRAGVEDIGKAFKDGFWAIMAPLVILGGIYSGFFTPTESAIVAIFYTLFVGFVIYRELEFKKLFHCLETTTWLTGRVLLILFTATVFGRLLVENRVPVIVAEGLLSMTDNLYVIWALIIMLLVFVGMLLWQQWQADYGPQPVVSSDINNSIAL